MIGQEEIQQSADDKNPNPVTIFISYDPEHDEKEKEALLSHLGVLQHKGLEIWSEDRIPAGANKEEEIKEALGRAKVVILLITAHFLVSDAWDNQTPEILELYQKRKLIIYPIIAKACSWTTIDWLSEMEVRPKRGSVWGSKEGQVDKDLADIVEDVKKIATAEVVEMLVPKVSVRGSHDDDIQTLRDVDWNRLLGKIANKKCTPFIGPEVCKGIIPTDHEIAQRLAYKYKFPLKDVHNLSKVTQFLATDIDAAFPADEVVEQLSQVETRPDADDLDEPHAFLARLDLPLYITTNFDNFMAQALKHRSRNVRQDVCRWNKDLKDQYKSIYDADSPVSPDEVTVVYHLFGHTEVPKSLVLTEDNYLDFLVNISKDQNIIPKRIKSALGDTALLFIGYELNDLRFQFLLRGVVGAQLLYTNIAVQLTPRPREAQGITENRVRKYLGKYFEKGKIKVYWGDSFEFVRELRQRWENYK